MGGLYSKTMFEQPPPEELSEFKKLAIAPEQYCIPEIQEKRQPTDKYFIYVYGAVAFILMIFISCTLYHRDIRRFTNGYDMCGNICGVNNEYVEGINCSGKDMRKFKYLLYDTNIQQDVIEDYDDDNSDIAIFAERHCAETCDTTSHILINNRCIPVDAKKNNGSITDPTLKQYDDVFGAFGNITLVTLIAIGMCVLMVVLFRYATAIVIWFIVVGCYLLLIMYTLYLWFKTDQPGHDSTGAAIVLTVISAVVTIIMIAVFKRIPLVISIFKEAMRAIWAMPMIIFEPLLTFVSVFITLLLFIIVTFNMLVCGVLVPVGEDVYDYRLTNTMCFTVIFNLLFTIWMITFIFGCQTMVVSGSISTWYFSRDKSFMGSPIKDSFKNLIKFHLGSVIFGSLILTAVTVFKTLVRTMMSNRKTKILVSCCLNLMERLLVYITKNAYIMIAMHGEDFLRSGKRAVKLIYLNLRDVITLNSIGDFVLFMAKLFVVILTILFSTLIHEETIVNYWLVISVGAIVGSLLAQSIFKVVETAIDTIFLCYCEDCCINDGIDRPYYMSAELMQFFEESRAVLASK